jgi:hypothetical protein
MPQAPLTPEWLGRVYRAVERHGGLDGAALELRIGRSTANKAYRRALAELGLPEARRDPRALRAMGAAVAERVGTFTPPVLPPSHEPVADMIARRKAAFARKRDAASAKRWMRFEIHENAPFALAFVGDPHADDDGCDLPTLEAHLELISNTPGMFGVGMGDWTNNWTGRLARLYAEQGTTASDAWRFAEWMLRRDGWMLLLRGNHDMWSGGGDPLRWISNGAAPLVDWSAQFVVACGDAEWRIEAAHDFPGSSMWNKLHAPLKRAKLVGQEADLYVCAHRHVFALAEEQDEFTGRVSWLARTRGYKALDSYAHVSGYGQQQDRGQSIAAVCTPEDRRMRCFSDLAEAADYLKWLRRPRVSLRAAVRG